MGVNCLRRQQDEGVAVECQRPRGCTASQANSTRIQDVDVSQEEAYAHMTAEEDMEQPESRNRTGRHTHAPDRGRGTPEAQGVLHNF